MKGSFRYAAEKFDEARRILMVPHPRGEAEDLAAAFMECSRGLGGVSDESLDGSAMKWVATVLETLDTDGIEEDPINGKYLRKARALSLDQKIEFSNAVDGLADWFNQQLNA